MIPNVVRFWLLLLVLIPSVLCCLFTLYHLLFDRANRLALNNHIIILLLCFGLISELTVYPWMIYYNYLTSPWERPTFLCQFWALADYGICAIQYILFAWATLERHILVFHDNWVNTRKKRILVHYLPILLLLLYSIPYHLMVVFFPPCQNTFNSMMMWCVSLCMMSGSFLSYDTIAHHVVTVLSIILFSILLLVRVIWRKRRLRRAFPWRKHRRMVIQLLSISFLYLVFGLPHTIWYIAFLADVSMNIIIPLLDYAAFLTYFPTLLMPFICASLLPNIRSKLARCFPCSRAARVVVPLMASSTLARANRL